MGSSNGNDDDDDNDVNAVKNDVCLVNFDSFAKRDGQMGQRKDGWPDRHTGLLGCDRCIQRYGDLVLRF